MSQPVDVPQIDANEAHLRVSDGATLLDVREHDEWNAGHAPVARHVPMGQVPAERSSLPVGTEIVVICRSGGRSQQVAQWLRAQGYVTLNLAGGMQAWSSAGLPVVTDTGDAGTVI